MGVTGSAEEVGPVEAAADAAADAEAVAAFCTAPDEPVVDEHPAIAAVASTSPTVSVLKRVLIASLDPWGQGCGSPRTAVRRRVTGFGSLNLRLVQVRPVRCRKERNVVDVVRLLSVVVLLLTNRFVTC